MPTTLSLDVPSSIVRHLSESPEAFQTELRMAAAVKWYELGRLSQGEAAALAGLSRAAFLDALTNYAVSPFQIEASELAQDVQHALGQK